MDTALQAILSYQFVIFCLAISAITYVVTIVATYYFNMKGYILKESHLWSNLILPLFPIILGICIALLIKQYPYPVDMTSYGSRFLFGLVAGLISTFVWRWIKALMNKKIEELTKQEEHEPENGHDGPA